MKAVAGRWVSVAGLPSLCGRTMIIMIAVLASHLSECSFPSPYILRRDVW